MTKRRILLILLLAAAVRFGLVAAVWNQPRRIYKPDSFSYVELMSNLGETLRFERDDRPEIFRTPGYPVFLLYGQLFGHNDWRAILISQAALDVLLVYLTYLLGSVLVNRAAGAWVAAFQAVTPVSVAAALHLLTDSLFALLLLLSLASLVLHLRTGRWGHLFWCGILLVMACYVRPAGLAAAAVFLVTVLLRPRRLRRAGLLAALLLAGLGPWVVRNGLAAEYWGYSSFAGDSMYFFAVPEVKARVEGGDPAALRRRLKNEAEPRPGPDGELPPPGPAAVERRRKAVRTLMEHPGLYARLHLQGCLGVYLPAGPEVLELLGVTAGQRGTSDVLRKEGVVPAARHYFGDRTGVLVAAAAMALIPLLKYLAAVGWVLRSFWRRMPAEIYVCAALVVVYTLLPGPFGLPRYRVPIAPLLSIAAGGGVAGLIAWLRRPRRGKPKLSVAE